MSQDISWISGLLFIIYLFTLVVYRIYFHPLSRFPGPKLAAATGWYETYIDLLQWPQGNFMEEIDRMHYKYGPIVRINPHEIHVRDSKWIDTLYASPAHGRRDKYPPTAYMTGTPKGVFGTVSHDLHKLRRSAISPLFSKTAAISAVPMIYDHTEKLINRIETQMARDGFAEMRTNCLAFTTDNIAQFSTGRSRGLLESEELAVQWRHSIKNLAEWTLVARHFSWLIPLTLEMPMCLLKVIVPNFSRVIELHRDMRELAKSCIEMGSESDLAATKKDPSSADIFHAILSNEHLPLAEKADHRISQEGVVAIAAGGETTARAITTALYFVLENKGSLRRELKEELEHAMPDPYIRLPLRELEALPCLSNIVKESLRIMALPTTRFPLVCPVERLRYHDWVIPAGTPVSMTLREVLLDQSVFDRPHEFLPERWTVKGEEFEKLNRCFVPFGRGNRMCIGINFAYTEIYIALACIFRRLALELYETYRERDIDIVRDCFIGETSLSTQGIRVTYARNS
ncbi:cytochrome P450 [Xylaria flabelliformis]|nr:cytochrome P450 [Xylaria flabelliformis]